MSDKTFVDTNVLIYAHDVDVPGKRKVAISLLHGLWAERNGVLSVQVLQEFYVNVTRKIARPLSKTAARQVVTAYSNWAIEVTAEEISSAFRIEDQARIGFWDALIVACALKSGASRILSEDLHAGQRIAGIRIENPFSRSADR